MAPGLDIEGLTDVALKHTDVKAGILVVERQFGYLEFHSRSTSAVQAAAGEVLDAARRQTRRTHAGREILASQGADPHRSPARLPHQPQPHRLDGAGRRFCCSCSEMQPASYAILATNEAEKSASIKVVDYRMIGATGRVYLAGREAEIRNARDAAEAALMNAARG